MRLKQLKHHFMTGNPHTLRGVNIEMVITNVNTQEFWLLTGAPQ